MDLSDYIDAPLPYIIGINTEIFIHLDDDRLDNVVIVDIDQSTISTEYLSNTPVIPHLAGTNLYIIFKHH